LYALEASMVRSLSLAERLEVVRRDWIREELVVLS
jgi:hypothetical protein